MSAGNDATKALKKKIVIICFAIGVGMILLYGLFSLISFDLDDFLYEEGYIGNAVFPYEPDFEENIFEDKKYMDMDRLICYTELDSGVTVSVDESNYASYGEVVRFMFEYINSIINGDTVFYNECYNQLYIDAVGKQSEFTMQKLYDIEFCVIQSGKDTLTGVEYTKLWLDYKIYKNNTTLRTDIGSDVCRRQYITLVKNENDMYKIQAVEYENIKPEKVLLLWRAILLIAVTLVIIAGIIAFIIYTAVKNVKKKPEQNKKRTQKWRNQPRTESKRNIH